MYALFRKAFLKLAFIVPLLEVFIFCQYASVSNTFKAAHSRNPVSYLPYGCFVVTVVYFNVTSRQVGYCRLIAIRLFLEYQSDLVRKRLSTIASASKVHPQLERHIETIMFPLFAGLTSAKVMDGVPR